MTRPGALPPGAATAPAGDETALLRQLAELAEAVAARDTFIAVAAHELRNPMTPIIGQVELLLNAVRAGKCPPAQVEQRLQRLQHAMARYLKRANTLLDVSRITTGQFRVEPTAFDLAALLRDVADTFADMARHAGAPVLVEAPVTLPVTLDRLAVEQILDNLLSNALKYGGHAPVALTIEAEGEQVRLRVRDRGPGIPERDRARIFQRFERAVGREERRSGFGLGLWIVGRFAEAMDGRVAVDDAPGGGALFTVTLPRHMPAPPEGGRP